MKESSCTSQLRLTVRSERSISKQQKTVPLQHKTCDMGCFGKLQNKVHCGMLAAAMAVIIQATMS